jgi:hypothetical protein
LPPLEEKPTIKDTSSEQKLSKDDAKAGALSSSEDEESGCAKVAYYTNLEELD